MIWNFKRAFVASLPFLIAFACQPLSDIPDDQCGNRVVEPERNEDCDELSDRCYPPGDPNECRFRCETTADCDGGFTCGLDGICRAPLGAFTLAYDERGETSSLALGDFDADGRLDLVHTSTDAVKVRYFDGTLTTELVQAIGRNSDAPVLVADLDDSGGDDLVAPVIIGLGGATGLGVYLSEARTFTPSSFASFPVGAKALRGTPADGVFPPNERELLVVAEVDDDLGGGIVMFGISTRSTDQVLQVGGLPHPDDIVGMDSLRHGPGCEWVVIAERGKSALTLIKPCNDQVVGYGWKDAAVPATTREIPLTAPIVDPVGAPGVELYEPLGGMQAVFTGDFDGNGLEDVAVTVASGAGNGKTLGLHITYQVQPDPAQPEYAFHSQPPPNPLPMGFTPDNGASELVVQGNAACAGNLGTPLAVADINADGRPDVAYRNATAISVVSSFYDIRCGQRWRRAAAGDLDGSGTLDFVGARFETMGATTGIEVLLSADDGVLTRYLVPTESPVDFLTVSNFDGDQADDFVYAERAVEGELQPFYAVFGQATGGFDPPKFLGALPNVVQVVSARATGLDAAADVVAVSALGGFDDGDLVDAAAAILIGSSSREILAPYSVSFELVAAPPTGLTRVVTNALAVAHGDFAGPALAIVTRDVHQEGVAITEAESLRLMMAPQVGGTVLGAVAKGSYDPASTNGTLSCTGCLLAAVPGAAGDVLWSFGTEGVSRHPANSDGFGAGQPIEIPTGDTSCDGGVGFDFGEDAPRNRDAIVVRDVDGDGHSDVLAYAKRCEAGAVVREAIVFFNDGEGGLAFDRTFRVSGSSTCLLESAALVQLDATPARELVVAFTGAAGSGCAGLVRFTPEAGALAERADGIELTGADGAPLVPAYRPEVLVGGDMDGDAIDDLAVGGFEGFAIYRGLAVRP